MVIEVTRCEITGKCFFETIVTFMILILGVSTCDNIEVPRAQAAGDFAGAGTRKGFDLVRILQRCSNIIGWVPD
jgi:hypothetical protein